MSKRTTTSTLAAGLIALSLPLSASAQASPLYRFDQPIVRDKHSVTMVVPNEPVLAELSQAVSAALDETQRGIYEGAIEDADSAIARAATVLATAEDDEFPEWQIKTEAAEAQMGLEAAAAHIAFARRAVDAQSIAAVTLEAISSYVSELLEDIAAF